MPCFKVDSIHKWQKYAFFQILFIQQQLHKFAN